MPENANTWGRKSDLAYQRVRQMIMSGDLSPGALLPQKQLAESLGMSLTPMREALKQLMNEGLVDLASYQYARVSTVTSQEVRDFMEVRLSLDPLAVFLAAHRHTTSDAERMREVVEDLRAVNREEGDAALIAHRRFHKAIYEASHNMRLISLLDDLWDQSDRYRRLGLELSSAEGARTRDFDEHRKLLTLVLDRDAEGARAVMRDHVNQSLIGEVAAAIASRETAQSGHGM